MRSLLQTLVWLLPASGAKNWLLRLTGVQVGDRVTVGPCLVRGLGTVKLDTDAHIGALNVFKGIDVLHLGPGTHIGSWNWVSAQPLFRLSTPGAGRFLMAEGAAVTSRHYLDCSGAIEMETFSIFGGHRTTVLTHEIDLRTNEQTCGTVRVGQRTLVSSNCMVLMGADVPELSLVAAGATLTRARDAGKSGLWAGSPARWVREFEGDWFTREEPTTSAFRPGHLEGRPIRLGGADASS